MKIDFFKKEERLCNKRLIDDLYHKGFSFLVYPFRITFYPAQALIYPAQVLISVPKKRFKRAVDRNLLKRRIREAYRLQKSAYLYDFLNRNHKQVVLSLQYISKDIEDYDVIFHKIKSALLKFQEEYAGLYLGENSKNVF